MAKAGFWPIIKRVAKRGKIMPQLIKAQAELLESYIGVIPAESKPVEEKSDEEPPTGIYLDAVTDSDAFDWGTKILYLKKAVTESPKDFRESIDRLGELSKAQLDVVESLKFINDICFNNLVRYSYKTPASDLAPEGVEQKSDKLALEVYFKNVGDTNPDLIKEIVSQAIAARAEELTKAHPEAEQQMAARLANKDKIEPNDAWRVTLDLPDKQKMDSRIISLRVHFNQFVKLDYAVYHARRIENAQMLRDQRNKKHEIIYDILEHISDAKLNEIFENDLALFKDMQDNQSFASRDLVEFLINELDPKVLKKIIKQNPKIVLKLAFYDYSSLEKQDILCKKIGQKLLYESIEVKKQFTRYDTLHYRLQNYIATSPILLFQINKAIPADYYKKYDFILLPVETARKKPAYFVKSLSSYFEKYGKEIYQPKEWLNTIQEGIATLQATPGNEKYVDQLLELKAKVHMIAAFQNPTELGAQTKLAQACYLQLSSAESLSQETNLNAGEYLCNLARRTSDEQAKVDYLIRGLEHLRAAAEAGNKDAPKLIVDFIAVALEKDVPASRATRVNETHYQQALLKLYTKKLDSYLAKREQSSSWLPTVFGYSKSDFDLRQRYKTALDAAKDPEAKSKIIERALKDPNIIKGKRHEFADILRGILGAQRNLTKLSEFDSAPKITEEKPERRRRRSI